MIKQICASVAALALASCGNNEGTSRLQATPEGVFYTSWNGNLYEVVEGKLVAVEKAPKAPKEPRSINFSETLPDTTLSGFPVLVTGVVKLEGGLKKTKVTLSLGPRGAEKPTSDQQTKFIDGLREDDERLKMISLSFYDAEGFVAAPERNLPINANWRTVVDANGRSTGYEFSSRERSSTSSDNELSSIGVGWVADRKPVLPQPVPSSYYPLPGIDADTATDAAATAADAAADANRAAEEAARAAGGY